MIRLNQPGPKVRGGGKELRAPYLFFHHPSIYHQGHQRGIALVMVLLVVTLASYIVIDLTRASTLEVQSNLIAERNLRAEYLLKSAINFGRALISIGKVPGTDKPVWERFSDGVEVPKELLGIEDRAVTIALEIRPVNSRIPIQALVGSGRTSSINTNIRQALVNLFDSLGFNDADRFQEPDPQYDNQLFSGAQMVANLIDYMDKDDKSYNDTNFVTGIESNIPKGIFPKDGGITDTKELHVIPGFTPNRIREIAPYIFAMTGAFPPNGVNINYASDQVLLALDTANVGTAEVQILRDYINSEDGPIKESNKTSILKNLIDVDSSDPFFSLTTAADRLLEIKALVDYGNSKSFMVVVVQSNSSNPYPKIINRKMY